jgi:hypothetical protein
MSKELANVKIGLAMVLLGLLFGIGLGITFGANEDLYQAHIAAGISAHPELHDAGSRNSIWRWVQRAHFHATGIGAFSLGLVLLVAFSTLKARWKSVSAVLIGMGGLYPLAWFTMFWLAPSIGRKAAHQHWLVDFWTYAGIGGLLLGLALLLANLFLHAFAEPPAA